MNINELVLKPKELDEVIGANTASDLLTPITRFLSPADLTDGEAISRATVKKMMEWGADYCLEPKHIKMRGSGYYRRECPVCWQEIKQALED